MQPTDDVIRFFQQTVWAYYATSKRLMPWRQNPEPYWVLVSEIMLQQTQVGRVLPKFEQFIERFPTIDSLASAELAELLALWSGLGYNRRAKFLWQAARIIRDKFSGTIPQTAEELTSLPGIGPNTAGAILAYAFNEPALFIETNVRTVYLRHFFSGQVGVDDKDLLQVAKLALDRENSREWYWALMDYGAHLKRVAGNNISNSRHYVRQTKFKGSHRQLRGQVLKLLLSMKSCDYELLMARLPDERLAGVIDELKLEGFLTEVNGKFAIAGK
ncbi:MAG TPA: hypothetical protein VNG90_01440 [Candidatus Acidoferrum sp.]|nr:hypothetical protein [Candidatus Acidoferrum sp.]